MICFNFASRSRPEKFISCLDNIRQFISDKDYFVLAKIDEDDRFFQLYVNAIKNYPEVIPVYGRSINKVHAINRGFEGIKFDILCNHSDDMFFVKKDFDLIVKEHCVNDTFLHIPDQQVKVISTYSIMDWVYFNRFKYVYHSAYRSLWCDNEATEVAKRLGRYKFLDVNLIEHRHPQYRLATIDMQYRKTESLYWVDKRTFDKRKARNFA